MHKRTILYCFLVAMLPMSAYPQTLHTANDPQASAEKRRVAAEEELARVKKELEELKARSEEELRARKVEEELARAKRELEELKARKAENEMSQKHEQLSTDGEEITVYVTIEEPQEAPPPPPQESPQTPQAQGGSGYSVFSIRPKIFTGMGPGGIGGDIELGRIPKNGFYFSADINIGRSCFWRDNGFVLKDTVHGIINDDLVIKGTITYGGGLNIGGVVGKDRIVKNVFGITVGFWNTPIKVVHTIEDYDSYHYFSFGGIIWKAVFGREKNFDVTNKLLFGGRTGTAGLYGIRAVDAVDGDASAFIAVRRRILPNVTYSSSVGYTFIKKK